MNEKTFDFERVAEGYKNRPWLHKQVIEQFQKEIGLLNIYNKGLDIGCGAGLSSKALSIVCDNVVCTDISPEMINVAKQYLKCEDKDYKFHICRAEQIPENDRFDIITAAGVMNWVDETLFLPKLNNILAKNGYFLVYDFWISDRMKDNSSYTEWYQNQYLIKYPKPKRKENEWTNQTIKPYNLCLFKKKYLCLDYDMNLSDFVDFMLLQSNVIAKVDELGKSINEAREWFTNSLNKIWTQNEEKLFFDGYLWIIKKNKNYSSEPEIENCGCIYG